MNEPYKRLETYEELILRCLMNTLISVILGSTKKLVKLWFYTKNQYGTQLMLFARFDSTSEHFQKVKRYLVAKTIPNNENFYLFLPLLRVYRA